MEPEFTREDPREENPVNIGFPLEPVVGIGRFNPMNGAKIADLLRKSTSLGKSLLLSTSHFTGQSSGQFSGLRGKRSNPVGTHSKRHRLWGPLPSGHDSKLFPPLWTDFLSLGQKCHFRPISKHSNRSYLDTHGHQVTRILAMSIQVEYKSRAEQHFRGRFWSVEDNPPVNALSC